MKIAAFFHNNPTLARGEAPSEVWPDSCMLISHRPLYIPDFEEDFYALPMLALKIGRLGKCVAPKFALRYVSDFTAGFAVIPKSAVEDYDKENGISAGVLCFDNAVVAGNWQPLDILPTDRENMPKNLEEFLPEELKFEFRDGDDCKIFCGTQRKGDATTALTRFSERNTIKVGDILMIPVGISPVKMTRNMTVKGFAKLRNDNDYYKELLLTRLK